MTPPIEENIARVTIDNELIDYFKDDIEYAGIMPIPNDDEDYLDYVEATGDPYGPFTRIDLDVSNVNISQPDTVYNTMYWYLSERYDSLRTAGSSYVLANTIFILSNSNRTISVTDRYVFIRITIGLNDNPTAVRFYINRSGSSQNKTVEQGDYYTLIDNSNYKYYLHICDSTDVEYNGDVILYDDATSNEHSTVYLNASIFDIQVKTE